MTTRASRFLSLLLVALIRVESFPTVKDPRLLGLINLVRFKNNHCTTASSTSKFTRIGSCYSSKECKHLNGTVDGSCASGFGVCCVLTRQNCGSELKKNGTYIQNPKFPSKYKGGDTTCKYTVVKGYDDICRIRLDFQSFDINDADPNTGSCGKEYFKVRSSSGLSSPKVCGRLTGQHMYLSTGMGHELGHLSFNFDGSSTPRHWDILVTVIPCHKNAVLPPDGCLQYFTGVSGTFENYNFGRLLEKQGYNYCFRQEEGYCKIQFSVSQSFGGKDPFKIDKPKYAENRPGTCNFAQLIIPSTRTSPENVGNFYCGNYLNVAHGATENGAVTSDVIPFSVRLTTLTDLIKQTGFRLEYMQIPCV